jgi:SAM-dependent methyltransferase
MSASKETAKSATDIGTQCPVCGRAPRRGKTIGFCECGHRWLLTSEAKHRSVEADTYTSQYAGYVPDQEFAAFARRFVVAEIADRCPPPARLLDVGCGAGEFLEVANALGYDATGIDVSEQAVSICRAKGINSHVGDLPSAGLPGKFDVITMWDVVEHVRDPCALLAKAAELLSDRGLLFAKVPAFGSLSVRMSDLVPRLAGPLLRAPAHVQFFTPSSLARLGSNAGLAMQCDRRGDIRSPPKPRSVKHGLILIAEDVVKRLSGDHNLFVFGVKRAFPTLVGN